MRFTNAKNNLSIKCEYPAQGIPGTEVCKFPTEFDSLRKVSALSCSPFLGFYFPVIVGDKGQVD